MGGNHFSTSNRSDEDPSTPNNEPSTGPLCENCWRYPVMRRSVFDPGPAPRICRSCAIGRLEDATALSGTGSFADYKILGRLGEGSTAIVYRALLIEDGHVVGVRAIKIFKPGQNQSENLPKRLRDEVRLQLRLRHPNLVRAYGIQALPEFGTGFIVMELVPGETATRKLQNRRKPLPLRVVIEIIVQVLDGLHSAHLLGFIHGDLKDSNIFVSGKDAKSLVAKLGDYGLARQNLAPGETFVPRRGKLAGTVRFMAPEQILTPHEVTKAADIYSCGITLYRLLCGEYPHQFTEQGNDLEIVAENRIVPIETRRELPRALIDIVNRALQTKPEDRFATAAEMQEALRHVLD